MIRFTCQCGTPYTLADHLAGRTFKCTKCNATITLPQLAPPAAPPVYAPPPPQYASGAPADPARWGSSGTLPTLEPLPAPPPPQRAQPRDADGPGTLDFMPEDAPTVDPDRDPPAAKPPPKKKTTKARPAEKLDLSDQLDLMPEDAPTADPDRDDIQLAKAALEDVAGSNDELDNSLERSSERPKKGKKSQRRSARAPAATGKESARSPKRTTGTETPSVAMECPACGDTIARVATECPSCGIPLRGGKKGGLSAQQKQLVGRIGAVAGVVVLLVGVAVVVKMLKDDTGGGTGTGKKQLVTKKDPKKDPKDPAKDPSKEDPKKDPPSKEDPKKDPPPKDPPPKEDPKKDPPRPDPILPKDPPPKDPPKEDPKKDPPRPDPTPPKDPPPKDPPKEDPKPKELPDGPLKDAILALRDATDANGVEKAAKELGTKDGVADGVLAYMKSGDATLRGRITRALLSRDDARSAALSQAWRSDEIEVLVPAIETSAAEGKDALLQKIEGLRGRSRDTILIAEAFAKCLVGDAAPESVAVNAARGASEKDKDLAAHLSPVLLLGGDGGGLANAPDALTVSCIAVRKAAKRGLESFLNKKGEKDPEKDPEGARAEWRTVAVGYAPIRDKLAKACEDGNARGISAEQLASIVDARLAVLAQKKDALAALPTFVRDAAAKTSAAGAALAELIPRLAHGEDATAILNQVIDSLGEDSRVAAAGIITGCLRAADGRVAPAAARAVDKGIVGFQQATDFPDLIDPSSPPKTCLDSPDPYALVAAASFRGDSKAIEKLAWGCRDSKVVEEALARLGSHETERRLMASAVGKDKIPNYDGGNLLMEVGTKGYISELKSFVTGGKDFDRPAYGTLIRTAEKACAGSDASILLRIGDHGRERGDQGCAGYYNAAARAAGLSDNREAKNAVYNAIKTLSKAKAAPPKDDKTPALPGDLLRNMAARGMPDANAEAGHADATAVIEKFLTDAKTARLPQPPPEDDLNRFIRTATKESLAKDQGVVKSCFDLLTTIAPNDKDRFTRFVYRALARFLGPAVDGARAEVEGARTAITALRGDAAVVLGRAKETSAVDALRQVVSVLIEKKRFIPSDAGVAAGLALIDGKEGGAAARRLLEAMGDTLTPEVREGCFFALAKSSGDEDAKVLTDWARKPDEKAREQVARAIGYAVRSPGGASAGVALIDRLRVDPSHVVRAEAAIACMELGRDQAALLDGALALDPQDRHPLEKLRGGALHLAATGDHGDTTTLFLDLCRSYEKLGKGQKLEARPGMNQGRTREVVRLARAGCRR